MGSTRTASVSCVQTILGFAKVVWILSVSGECFLSGAQYLCELEYAKVLWRKHSVIGKREEWENKVRC